MTINKDWLAVCKTYSDLKGISFDRVVNLSILIWVQRDIGEIPLSGYEDLGSLLVGKKPFPGAWVKSADRKKTKGVVRPDDDPTCYTFEAFITDYAHRKSVKEAKAAYSKLVEKDREAIKRTLPQYILETPDKKFRLHPSTYINSRKWEDYSDEISLRVFEITEVSNEDWKGYLNNPDKLGFKFADIGTLRLTEDEYIKISSGAWKNEIKGTGSFGTSVIVGAITDAHQKSKDVGGTVYQNFIEILNNK